MASVAPCVDAVATALPAQLNVPPLEGALAAKAQAELHETLETRSRSVLLLREAFATGHPGLLPRDDDAFLLRFLRARKFDVARAEALLCNYCNFRRSQSDLFNVTADEMEAVLSKGILALLPGRDKNGCRILVISSKNIKLNEVSFRSMLRVLIYMCEKVIEDHTVQINGVVVAYDLAGYPLGLMPAIQSAEKRAAMQWTENCFPIRFCGAHLVNQPWYVGILLAIVKTFTTKKILSRVFLHGSNMESLHSHFDAALLPPPLGTLENFDPLSEFREDLDRLRAPEGANPITASPSSQVDLSGDRTKVDKAIEGSRRLSEEPTATAAVTTAVPEHADSPPEKHHSTNPFDD